MLRYMNHIIPAIITLIVIASGHILFRLSIRELKKRIDFIVLFNNNFIELAESYLKKGYIDSNTENYDFCIANVDKVQNELGRDGVVHMSDNLKGVSVSNYGLFSNIFIEMRQSSSLMFNSIMRERMSSLFGTCADMLRKHIGNLDYEIELISNKLYNPFACFAKTIQWILDLPTRVLVSFGIITGNRQSKIRDSIIYKIINLVINILGVVSAIMTIVLGWDDFLKMVTAFFSMGIR